MIHQEVLYAVSGQTLYFDPPEGQPTGTPTVTVYYGQDDDTSTAEAATTGACSVDSVSTTFSASLGDRSITVDSGTGIVRGRRYLIADTDGNSEWVEVRAVSGTTVTLRHPLKASYAAGSTFKGCRISISFDSTWISDSDSITDILETHSGAAGYRARWSYTVDSVARIGVSYFDVVRYQAKNLVTPLDVDRRFPGWLDCLPTDYQEDGGLPLIDEAFAAVKMDALGDDHVLRRIRDTQVLRELTIYRANLLAQEAGQFSGGTNLQQVEAAERLYQNRYKQLVREPKVPVDQTGEGAASEADRLPAWRR